MTYSNSGALLAGLVMSHRVACSSVDFLLEPAIRKGMAGGGDLIIAAGGKGGSEVRGKCRATVRMESSVLWSSFLL